MLIRRGLVICVGLQKASAIIWPTEDWFVLSLLVGGWYSNIARRDLIYYFSLQMAGIIFWPAEGRGFFLPHVLYIILACRGLIFYFSLQRTGILFCLALGW